MRNAADCDSQTNRRQNITESTVNCQIFLAINQAKTSIAREWRGGKECRTSRNAKSYDLFGASLSNRLHRAGPALTITLNLICRTADAHSQGKLSLSLHLSLSLYAAKKGKQVAATGFCCRAWSAKMCITYTPCQKMRNSISDLSTHYAGILRIRQTHSHTHTHA